MKAFLISLGLLLVTALTVALIGPVFVDWTGYRTLVEERGERLIGRPVAIGGSLDVRILPRPVVRAGVVRVPGERADAPVFSAEKVEVHLNLGALILGNVEVSELTVAAPEVAVDQVLQILTGPGRRERQGARGGTLSRIVVNDAALTFADPFASGTVTATGVDFQVLASTLSGPFKVTGSYGARGEGVVRSDFSATIGTIDQPGPIRIAGRIAAGVGDVSFDGALHDLTTAARYQGKLKLVRAFEETGEGPPGRMTAEAIAEIAPGQAEFTEIKLVAAENAKALTFAGSGRGSWDGPPRFSADLKARQIDLDGALEGPDSQLLTGEVTAIAQSLARMVSDHGASGRVQLAVDGAIWRGELARDIRAAIQVTPGAIDILSLQASLPGETQFDVSGRIELGARPVFGGDLVAETLEAGRLARWVAPQDGALIGEFLAKSRGKFSLRSSVGFGESALTLEAVDGIADGNPFSGSLHADFAGTRPVVRADLVLDLIDLDRYLSADAAPSDLLDRLAGWNVSGGLGADLVVDARAKRVNWLGREAEGVELAVMAGEEGADIIGFNVARFAGATIAAEGHLAPSPGGTLGAIQLSLQADNLEPLVDFLGIGVPVILGSRPSLREADLVVAIESEAGDGGALSTVSASGDVSGSSVEASATSRAALAGFGEGELELSVQIEASDAAQIIGPGGLVPLLEESPSNGAGRLAITARGHLADGLELKLVGEGFGSVIEAGGDLAGDGVGEGRLTFAAGEIGAFGAALGLYVPPAAGGAPAELAARLSAGEGELRVEIERGFIAGTRVGGTVRISTGAPRRVHAALETSLVSLPWIAKSVLSGGGTIARAQGAEAQAHEASWPTELVDISALKGIDLDATLTCGRLVLGDGVILSEAEIEFAVAGGILSLKRLGAGFGGGTIAGSGSVQANSLGLAIEGEIEAREVFLDQLVTDRMGRGLVAGLLNFESDFRAEGRSLLSLVASLEGSGTFAVSEAELPRFDGRGALELSGLAETVDAAAAALNIGRLQETALDPVSGKFEAANGRLKFGPAKLAGEGLGGTATSFIDVPSRRIDQEIELEGDGAPGVRATLIHAGALDDITREVELIDLPQIGSVRWSEPLDEFAVPRPDPESGRHAGASLGQSTEPDEAEAADMPPVGLIDQEIMDLPILEPTLPAGGDDGAG